MHGLWGSEDMIVKGLQAIGGIVGEVEKGMCRMYPQWRGISEIQLSFTLLCG